MIEISLDQEDAIKKLESTFKYLKDSNKAGYAISTALNKSMRAARKIAIELLQSQYSMPKDEARKHMIVRKATPSDFWAELCASGKGSRLINFQDGLNRKGVYVKLMGQRIHLRHMFIARTGSGFFSVFGRGYQRNYNPVFRKKRVRGFGYKRTWYFGKTKTIKPDLPIVSLRTISPYKGIVMDVVNRAVSEKTMNTLNKTIDKQIKNVLLGKAWDA